MNQIKEKFLEDIIKCLNDNELDVAYSIAPLAQVIDDYDFDVLFGDLEKYKTNVFTYEEDVTGGYTNGKIIISFLDGAENINHCYEIDLRFNYWGCWEAPIISVNRCESIIEHEFSGDEKSYSHFKKQFYKLTKENNEEMIYTEKENRITYLKNAIEQMQLELDDLV